MKLIVPTYTAFLAVAINLICLVGFSGNAAAGELVSSDPLQAQAEQAVFKAAAENDKGGISGTGFLVLIEGMRSPIVITNKHVCKGIRLFMRNAILIQGAEQYVGRAMRMSKKADLCAITVNEEVLNSRTPYQLADREARTGDSLTVFGHPQGRPLERTEGLYLRTVVNPDTDISKEPIRFSFSTAHIEPGNSGSPVVGKDGRVVGVIFAEIVKGPMAGASVFIPLTELRRFLLEEE